MINIKNALENRYEYTRRWIEGCIIGYLRGTIDDKRIIGMINRASTIIPIAEIINLIKDLSENPNYLPSIDANIKRNRAKLLLEKLDYQNERQNKKET